MSTVTTLTPAHGRTSTLLWLALLLAAVLTYVLGLDGQYVPTNGDELVYSHIARLTAASGQWLPLVSELDHMRNTKPPLLIWQAMLAGDWGQHWTMAALRTPSVIYTLLLTGAIGFTVQRISRDVSRGLLAACLYLAFFSTFRFGRTYLTSAPETFWLSLPMFVLLWWPLHRPNAEHRVSLGWWVHALFGLAMGLGLAYKSFALIAPAAATLWSAQLLTQSPLNGQKIFQTTLKVSLSALIALGIFGLWFVLDPDPAAVWQEFVVGENAGKLNNSAGYWHTALFGGGFSIWSQLLGYAQNAGLLVLVIIGLMLMGARHLWCHRWQALTSQSVSFLVLLVWLGIWLAVFTVPSQRSMRYLIPAMPALAMVLALCWQGIGRLWFVPTLLLCGVFMGYLGRIAWAEQVFGLGNAADVAWTLIAVAMGLGLVLAGLFRPAWTRACTLAASLAVFAVFGLATVPLNGPSGHYSTQVLQQLQGQQVAVPSSFNGQFERFEFTLPGNHFVPYDGDGRAAFSSADNAAFLSALLEKHQAVVWLQTHEENTEPLCAPHCTVLGQRWEVKGRHQSGEITLANIWYPEQWLFRREWLLTNAAPWAATATSKP
ncbi:MAG: glycosyltransferase [Comamonadaceae bacterium]|nr:MAG: glycosyltransferase [Comamonadaceae bacterium]